MKVLPTTKNTNSFMVAYLLGMSFKDMEKNYKELYTLTNDLELLTKNKKLRVFRNLQLLRIDLVHGKYVPQYEGGQLDYFYNTEYNNSNAVIISELKADGITIEDYCNLTHASLFCKLNGIIEGLHQEAFMEAGIYNPTAVWSLFCIKNVKDSKTFRKYRGIIDKNIYLYFGGHKYFIFNSWRNSAYYRDTMLDSDEHLYRDVSAISGIGIMANDIIPCKYFLEDSEFIKIVREEEVEKQKVEQAKVLKKNKVKCDKVKETETGLKAIRDCVFYVDSDNLTFLQILKLITTTHKQGNKYRLYYDNNSDIQWGIFLHIFGNMEDIEYVNVPRLLNNKSVVDMQIYKDIILNGMEENHVIVSSDSDFFIATHEGYKTKVIYTKNSVSDNYLDYLTEQGIDKYELDDTLYGDNGTKQELLEEVLRKLMVIKMIELPIKKWDKKHLRVLLHQDVTGTLSDSEIILTSSLTDEIVDDILDNVKVTYEQGNLAVKLHEFEYKG